MLHYIVFGKHGIISDYPALSANNLSVAVILTPIGAFFNKILYFYYYLLLFALSLCYTFMRENAGLRIICYYPLL